MHHPSGNSISTDIAEPLIRQQRAKAIVTEVLRQRGQGQSVLDAEILATHPELSEELKKELEIAGQIRRAFLSARTSGPAAEALPLMTDSQIDDIPESPSVAPSTASEDGNALPKILGYFLQQEISRGGQATVFKALQESTGRTVAIKIITGGPFAGSQRRARFEREATVLASFDHPNIVGIIERGRTPDGSFYFVMQYVDGLPLDEHWSQRIASDARGTRKIVELFIRIAQAVEAAHERGVVHRDLKPSNIRVDRRDEPHILDFGLARSSCDDEHLQTQTLTMPGQIVGSLPWASPEQAAGFSSQVDVRSDVYSLGVILYQALTGQSPYSLQGPVDQVLLRIRTASAPPPSTRTCGRKGIDRRLDLVVLTALSKSAQDRYASAGKLANDLSAWLNGRPTAAHHQSPFRVLRMKGASVAVACLCLLGSMAVFRFFKLRSPAVAQLPHVLLSCGINMVRVPAGDFWFGNPLAQQKKPSQYIAIKNPFDISVSVVTQHQYEQVMKANPSDSRWMEQDMPVQNVSWNEAVEFCRRLSKLEHRKIRLPTEVEWEYACRAGTPDSFDATASQRQRLGWFAENSGADIHPVMLKEPNAWGLFDMHGNVAQWCQDIDASSPEARRVIRGGSALMSISQCSTTSRQTDIPTNRLPDRGFRVVSDS